MARITKPTIKWDRDRGLLHIETNGVIVNIQVGLRGNGNDADVTAVDVIADGDRFAGERPWWINGIQGDVSLHTRVVRRDE